MTNASIFKLDKKFIRELRRRLLYTKEIYFGSRSKPRLVDPESIPSVEQIEEIILALFWASAQKEEGRLSRYRVTFAEPNPLNFLALVFKTLKLWDVEELRKLSPAVIPPDGQIGVWAYGEEGKLRIWGLQTTGMMRVSFEVIDPGRVVVSHLGFKIAEISGQKAGFISPAWNRRSLEIMSRLGADGTPTGEVLSQLSIYVTQEILRRIRQLGHGGAVIFVPDSRKWVRSVDQPVFYACGQHLNEMQRIREALEDELRQVNEKTVSEENKQLQIVQRGMNLLGSHSYKIFIGNAARSIAYLSAVDGATVLNGNFEVLAFGVKLRAPRKAAKAVKSTTVTRILPLESEHGLEEVALDQEFRGTRHMSAAQFVLNNPGAIAFVVSQDGGITGLVMRRVNGSEPKVKLLAFRRLELLL